MKLIIFGATGSVGKQVVNQALNKGHQVTAFVRDAAKVAVEHKNLHIATGNAMDATSVENAIQGHDAVLVSIGAGRKGTVRSEATRHIITAMKKLGIRRLICQSTLGVGNSRGNLNVLWKYIMFGLLLRQAYADHVRQEAHVKKSGLDWTIVRPGAFVDGELTGDYRHGFSGSDKTTKLKISRSDVADFMLKQLFDPRYLHKTPGLSY